MAVENVAHDLRAATEGGGVHDACLQQEDPLVGVDALDARPGLVAGDETRLSQRRQGWSVSPRTPASCAEHVHQRAFADRKAEQSRIAMRSRS